jgi:hypothetical protein
MDDMITVSDAAEILGTYPKQVRRLIDRGEITGARKLSNKRTAPYLIPRKSVLSYKAKQEKKRAAASKDATAR